MVLYIRTAEKEDQVRRAEAKEAERKRNEKKKENETE